MTVTQTFQPIDIVAIKAGKELTIKAADDLAAEMLIKAYVPEYPDGHMTFQEARDLAEMKDEQAAYELEQGALDLEASIKTALDSEEEPAEDEAAVRAINMLLESAARADRLEAEAAVEAVGL